MLDSGGAIDMVRVDQIHLPPEPGNSMNKADVTTSEPTSASYPRAAVGGVLMGIANLIPGVSGGTMILAIGIYNEFIDSVADVTALRFSLRRFLFLGVLGFFALGAIKGLAPLILYLLFHYTSAMYALFIGLTLGGAPLLWRSLDRKTGSAFAAMAAGMAMMVMIAVANRTSALPVNMAVDVGVGMVAAVTMVLPGISGSYMLLILGQYDRVVAAVEAMNLRVLIPVAVGAGLGIVLLSNALKFLLHRFERATMGFLLGMLLGSVIGLWPFGREPSTDALEKRSTAELLAYMEDVGIDLPEDRTSASLVEHISAQWEARTKPDYDGSRVAVAGLMLVAGFGATTALGRRGRKVKG